MRELAKGNRIRTAARKRPAKAVPKMTVEVDDAISGTVIPSWDHLVAEGKQAAGFQWKLGDLAGQVEIRYGESSLANYADEIGVEYNTLLKYRKVARAYPESWRQRQISYTVHAELHSHPDRLELVGTVKTAAEARALVAGRKELPKAEPKPIPGPAPEPRATPATPQPAPRWDDIPGEDQPEWDNPPVPPAPASPGACPAVPGKPVGALRGMLDAFLLDCDPESAAKIAHLLTAYAQKFQQIKEGSS